MKCVPPVAFSCLSSVSGIAWGVNVARVTCAEVIKIDREEGRMKSGKGKRIKR
jgi:hypothetical protein